MKRYIAVVALASATPLLGQSVRQQAKTITFPTFTAEQNWTRASTLVVAGQVGGFAIAKARGMTADEYGRASAEAFAPGWGPAESGSAIRYARGIQNNLRALNGSVVEVLSVSDTMVTMRASRPQLTYFGPTRQALGVTLDEYEAVGKVFNEAVGRHLGLRYTQRVDSAWVTMTISGGGKNSIVDYPRATYAVSLNAQEAGANASLVGNWEATYGSDGKYTLRHDGQPFVEASYEISFDEIVFTNEKTPAGNGCANPGRYRWTVNSANGNLGLGRLSDDCAPRVFFLTRKAFTKK